MNSEELLKIMGDRIVLKPLTRWSEMYKEFPRYVMEYLVARYVDPKDPVSGQKKIDKLLNEHYVESSHKELIKSRIKENNKYALLGQLTVRLDSSRDLYWAEVPAIGENFVRVSRNVFLEYGDALLSGGAWGTMVIEYDPNYELKGKKYPFYISDFHPFQITRLDLNDYIEKRRLFTTDEWIDLLIESIGFNPKAFSEREKMLMLLRLVPFVEPNYNLIELGPRETGKTYTFRNTSSRSFVISGGKTTPASLFYNQTTRKIGILGQKDVVFFDEIANTSFTDPDATISVLKDYMQTGKFSRGGLEFTTQASIVIAGNIETDIEQKKPSNRYHHLFEVLPEELRDIAFLDRIHAFLPGWEMPKIKPENYAVGYGFITDYLADIFSMLRRKNYQTIVSAHVSFGDMTGRNIDSIMKTTSGLLKLVFPHKASEDIKHEDLQMCLDIAVECRQRVIDQLTIMASEEFKNINLKQKIILKNFDKN
jgi:ATP-dependent Lon protease